MMQVNRSLEDNAMDKLDHALGRPFVPWSETSRNFFGVKVGSADAIAMKIDPNWVHTRDFMGTSGFAVSDKGKSALVSYLESNGQIPRLFIITFNGNNLGPIHAKTHSKAKYAKWLGWDTSDISFGDFCKATKVRLA